MAQILVSFILAVVLAACSPGGNEQGKAKPVTLHLFTWSDYTEETAVNQFEERFGVKVATDTFGSNEELLAKLQGGASGYDVVVPSDYMVSILIKQGLLAELDPAKIPNLAHVYKHLKGLYYDPQNAYSVVKKITYGKTEVRKWNSRGIKPPVKIGDVELQVREKYESGKYKKSEDMFSYVFRKIGNEWKIIAHSVWGEQ